MIDSPGDRNVNILIITELQDSDTIKIVNQAVETLKKSQLFDLYSQNPTLIAHTKSILKNDQKRNEKIHIDYIICIGENETLLHSLRFNKDSSNIPIVSISNGNQPIMSSYSVCDIDEVITKFIKMVKKKEVKVQKMMKMQVFSNIESKTKKFLTNFSSELEIHRDMKSSVLKIQIYLRAQGKDFYELTTLWGDGLIISTPFGSIGRSMAHNGPLLHKNIQCIEIIPVCPLSLKFRPIVIPKDCEILIKVSQDSRSVGQIFADGQLIGEIKQNQQIKIRKDATSTLFVKNLVSLSEEVSWILKLQEVLSWGEHYQTFKGTKSKSGKKKQQANQLISSEKIIEEGPQN